MSKIDLRQSGSPIRESRLGSISGYCGTLQDLNQRGRCGKLRNGERCFSQASLCNAACAMGVLSFITDAAIVQHSPTGCAVTAMQVSNSREQLAAALGLDLSHSGYVCTDMNETDAVFGATDKLRDVVRETHRRYHPRAIFIGASCVSGVIGEDLDSAATELSAELEIPVAPVHCEGFRTRIWASGFDAAFHAILTAVVQPPRKHSNTVNVINFFGSARREITDMFSRLGVEPWFVISNTSVEQLSRLSESMATTSTCGTLGSYLGHGLEQNYGVPYVRTLQPHGIAGFEDWLRGLGRVLGQQKAVESLLDEQRQRYLASIEAIRQKLKGLRALVGMGPGFNFNTTRALQELGVDVIHSAAWHFDKQYDDGQSAPAFEYLVEHSTSDIGVSVSDIQNHELVNLLARHKPDVYFSRHVGSTVWAMKLGIPALCLYDEYAIFGYRGLHQFGQSILDVVTNRSFTDALKRRVRLPYTDWWLSQQHNYFLNQGDGE